MIFRKENQYILSKLDILLVRGCHHVLMSSRYGKKEMMRPLGKLDKPSQLR